MKYELPKTDNDLIAVILAEYTAAQSENESAVRDAQHRLAWAYVHASDWTKVQLGIDLSEQLLNIEGSEPREAEYYIAGNTRDMEVAEAGLAVGLYRQRQYLAARSRVTNILERWPSFHQATELKNLIEDALIKEGLLGLGVGIGAAAVVGLGAVAAALLSKR